MCLDTAVKSFAMASMPNGNYHLTVRIAEGEGEGGAGGGGRGLADDTDAQQRADSGDASAAATRFIVDVGVELTEVEEEEEEVSSEEEEAPPQHVPPARQAVGGGGGGGLDGVGGGVEREGFSEEDLLAIGKCRELGMTARTRPARIFDGFTYKDEIELLQVRVEEYGDLVRAMIVVEATSTFQGAARELALPQQLSVLPPAMQPKIRHVVVDFEDWQVV
jgi:hypothetical protein